MDPDEFESAAGLALWQSWVRFDEHESDHFRRYLAMRVRGECTDAIRARHGRHHRITECVIEDALSDTLADNEDVEATAITAAVVEQLRALVTPKQWDMARTWAQHEGIDATARQYGCSRTNVVQTGTRTVARLHRMVGTS